MVSERERNSGARGLTATRWGSVTSVLALLAASVLILLGCSAADTDNVPYSTFRQYLSEKKVAEITVMGNTLWGVLRNAEDGSKDFRTTLPSFGDPGLMELLRDQGVTVFTEGGRNPWLIGALIGIFPVSLAAGLLIQSTRRSSGGRHRAGGVAGNAVRFGKSRARLYQKSGMRTTFEDVAGLANVKRELSEVIDFLKTPSKYLALGGKLPRGVLLTGPPGTGKTLLARAVAGEAQVPFFSISGSEFMEMFVGVGASRVRDMFANAKKRAPSIIYIDEIDSIGRVRSAGMGQSHDEREQTLNQILTEMDGFSPNECVIVMAATNRPDVLDPALVRPGRFDRRITLDLPQKRAREEILRVHARHVPLAKRVDLTVLAERTPGFSGADLMNLINEAALLAARKGKAQVDPEDLEQSRDRVLMGIEREDLIHDDERRVIAYHEAGHALVALYMPSGGAFQRVSIIPRRHALGTTEVSPEEDRHILSRSCLLGRIAVMLGGRAAERLALNDITTGGSDDLKRATGIARRMVRQWGMSETLGPVTFRQGEEDPYLGAEIAMPRDFSEHTARLIDEEVRRIVKGTEEKAEEILRDNLDDLHALALALLEQESLTREQVESLLESQSRSNRPAAFEAAPTD
ncbi:MAG: ATP-dependent zinc metalloprotease FtsH [bacterium]